MKAFLRRVVAYISWIARVGFWFLAILVLSGLITLISVPAGLLSFFAAFGAGVRSRSEKTVGAALGFLFLIGVVIWLFVQPHTAHPPLTSCSVTPVPFTQRGSRPPVTYDRAMRAAPVDSRQWVNKVTGETYAQLSVIEGAGQ